MKTEDEKWKKLLNHRKHFRHIPFINFALVAGSMAMGEVNENSDFDIIIGAEEGRIWTTRYFSIIIFGVLGIRKKSSHNKKRSSDKFCFNHFVTPKRYTLSPPHNKYWIKLYNNLVPIYGKNKEIKKFFQDNFWAGNIEFQKNKLINYNPSLFSKIIKWIFSGKLGNLLEKTLERIQKKRIESGIKKGSLGYKPLLVYNNEELRFHIDTKRIEKWVNSN